MTNSSQITPISTTGRNATLVAALLGWMFDGFEMGLFPLIGRPALKDLLACTGQAGAEADWFGVIIAVFLVGWRRQRKCFLFFFGQQGPASGRCHSALLCYVRHIHRPVWILPTETWHIAVLRFIASLGMGGEWSLESPSMKSAANHVRSSPTDRGRVKRRVLLVAVLSMGLTGFIGGVHSLLMTIGISEDSSQHLLANSAWRFLMISGAFPALLTSYCLFVPNERNGKKNDSGKTSHWNNVDLFGSAGGLAAARQASSMSGRHFRTKHNCGSELS